MGKVASLLVLSSAREQLGAELGKSPGQALGVFGARVEGRCTTRSLLGRAVLGRAALAGLERGPACSSDRLTRRYRQSETVPATVGRGESGQCGAPKSLQIKAFPLTEGSCGSPSLAKTPSTPRGGCAKNRCDPKGAGKFVRSPTALTTESPDPSHEGGIDIADDQEEGENPTSPQAFSGRPAGVAGRVPKASNETASPQPGVASSQRPNQSSACQSREQRQTGPRTPLRENEGRPRAKYDKKEHIKCSQVEVDSC